MLTEPETLQVEALDAGAAARDRMRVGVEGELAELKEAEGAGGAGLLGFGVRDYGGEAVDWALLRGSVSDLVCWVEVVVLDVMGCVEDLRGRRRRPSRGRCRGRRGRSGGGRLLWRGRRTGIEISVSW